ncbi:MAG: bifunctional oligoribonuclease/PAP phosphatase NrnA [Bacteroidales bacterium]|nr:bifunctional oligoribonuclease/PAP phosphatase NrnA [Bacteroidales bacterium]
MKNFEFEKIIELIGHSQLIAVTSHHNPDGDAIGSVLALNGLLTSLGKTSVPMVPNDYPGFLKWMPSGENMLVFSADPDRCKKIISEAGVIFCLDYNAMHRTDAMCEPLKASAAVKILIDHHPDPLLDDFNLYYSDIETSSTAELLYRFIRGCGWSDKINQPIAINLFTGIMTDTGSFSYACHYPETFEISADLIRRGVDPEYLHRMVFDTYSEHRLRLLGYCLAEKLTVLPELRSAYITLSKEELNRFHYQPGDTEGIVNYALSIAQINVAVIMTERKDRIRLSFRSKGDFSVNRLAREHFNGGGHKNAAGGDSFVSLEETTEKLKGILLQYKEDIIRSFK